MKIGRYGLEISQSRMSIQIHGSKLLCHDFIIFISFLHIVNKNIDLQKNIRSTKMTSSYFDFPKSSFIYFIYIDLSTLKSVTN